MLWIYMYFIYVLDPKWNCYSSHAGFFMEQIAHAKILQTYVSMIHEIRAIALPHVPSMMTQMNLLGNLQMYGELYHFQDLQLLYVQSHQWALLQRMSMLNILALLPNGLPIPFH